MVKFRNTPFQPKMALAITVDSLFSCGEKAEHRELSDARDKLKKEPNEKASKEAKEEFNRFRNQVTSILVK